MFHLGKPYPSYEPMKFAKNDHIQTAIDQFSKISFSEK